MIKGLKAVYVEWDDSSSWIGWHEKDRWPPKPIKSIGILVHEALNEIVISTSQSASGNYLDQLTIPRCSIKKVKRL